MMAAGAGHDSVVAALLERDADITIVNHVRFHILPIDTILHSLRTF
jgi:hypothetical protein